MSKAQRLVLMGLVLLGIGCPATDKANPDYTLTVAIAGTGTGRVTDGGGQIDCPGTCQFAYPASNHDVTLTAAPQPFSIFVSWSGTCVGTGLSISFTVFFGTCTATFDAAVGQTVPIPAITCAPVAPICNPPFIYQFPGVAAKLLIVYTAPATHCGSIKIEVTLDGSLKLTSGAVPAGGNTGNLDLGAIGGASHTLSLRGVGVPGGCIPADGSLTAWGGSLFVALL